MPKINYDPLPNKEAIAHFNGKVLLTTQHYAELKAYEHALAFTVAGISDKDMLTEVHKAMRQAMENGTSFADFKKQLRPYLMAKGWLAPTFKNDNVDDDKETFRDYQKHLGHRLRTIYHTGKATAYAGGQWERIQRTKELLPFLQYMPSVSTNKRDEHKQFYGLVREVDDPIWANIMPPNGFGCKCWVKQLTKTRAQKLLDEQAEKGIVYDIEMEQVKHPLTGEMMSVPKGVHFSFNHNHDRLTALLKLAQEKHGVEFSDRLKKEVVKLVPKAMLPAELLLVDNADELLPPPTEWKKVAKIGKEIYQKHKKIFDKVDFDKPLDFSNTVLEVMRAEGVEMNGIVNVYGDSVPKVQEILGRYPKSWVDKANEMGNVFVRNMDSRGWHIQLENQNLVNYFKQAKIQREYAIFQKFADQMEVGDSLLKLNNMGGKLISNKAYDITIHEFAHRLQTAIPELDDYFTQLWLDRTKGEQTRPLAVIQKERGERVYYDKSEVGRKDSFANVYVGKNYGTDDNPKPAEVMTMTFQQLLGSNVITFEDGTTIPDTKNYWQKDPELLYLALALLIRYKP